MPDLFCRRADDRFRLEKRECVQTADAIICISRTTRDDVLERYGLSGERVKVVPLAFNTRFRVLTEAAAGNGNPFLLYVGDRNHHKNFRGLMIAFSEWNRRHDVLLLVVGKPWQGDEQRLLQRLGITQYVRWVGEVEDDELCALYNRALAFVFPSLYEGFGMPVLEAMACGCPVVASRIPSTLEVAGDCPVYFDIDQPDSLLEALDVALAESRDPVRAGRGLARVKLYSWEETARRTLDIYREMHE